MNRKARSIMIFGTTSGAGKSFLATALCRWYARQGLRVLPFKAQNMSNNARVVATPDGGMGEIGSAQYFQALAAGVEPEVRMNPVLLKPEHGGASQLVLLGKVDPALCALPWQERSQTVWPVVEQSLHQLERECDLLIIEGAGSPAEINLSANDFVNLRTAEAVQANCLITCDIDRGGAFAHLYGTYQLLPESVRGLIKGFVLNKFRGDAALLAPGPDMLQALTGVPTLAVLPMQNAHGLPEEDGVFDDSASGRHDGLTIAVVVYPCISNLDEFQPLKNLPGVRLIWARNPADLDGADWIILPGSKQTSADLAWLRQQGFEPALQRHVAADKPLLAICGGLQMAGAALHDPHGVDGNAEGLHLLPLTTEFAAAKTVRRTVTHFLDLHGPWAKLSGCAVSGYEIHHGQTSAIAADMAPALPNHLGWQRGPVLALYLHGLFENPSVLHALFGAQTQTLDDVFDRLADLVEERFGREALLAVGGGNFEINNSSSGII